MPHHIEHELESDRLRILVSPDGESVIGTPVANIKLRRVPRELFEATEGPRHARLQSEYL
jgi:hypothetical protein